MKFPLTLPIQASEMRYFLPILCCACLVQVAPRPTDISILRRIRRRTQPERFLSGLLGFGAQCWQHVGRQ